MKTVDPSRRRFLAVGSAAAVFASLHEAIAAKAPDDHLIALGRELDAAWANEREMNESGSDAELGAACDKTNAIVGQIKKIPATTLEGFKIKARAVSWCYGGEFDGFNCGDTTDISMAEQIIRDLLAI